MFLLAINSCELSNHTGYPHFQGRKSTGDDLLTLVDGLKKNNLLNEYNYLLTGYMSNVSFFNAFLSLLPQLHKKLYLCDPVMGDAGKMYTPKEFVNLYKSVLPHADICTPNAFEAELLTDIKISSLHQAFHAACNIHQYGVKYVVITSLLLEEDRISSNKSNNISTESSHSAPPTDEYSSLHVIPSDISLLSMPNTKPTSYYHLILPHSPRYYSGTGDLTSSLLIAHLIKGTPLYDAIDKVMTSVQAVMKKTDEEVWRKGELDLIGGRLEIEDSDMAKIQYKGKKIDITTTDTDIVTPHENDNDNNNDSRKR